MTDLLALNSIRGKSGKDTLIGLLESEGRTVFRVAFADILKKQCAEVLCGGQGFAERYEQEMHSGVKDRPQNGLAIQFIPNSNYRGWLWLKSGEDREEPRSLRWHLQKYGTEYRREFCKEPDVWLDLGMLEVRKGLDLGVDHVVVTDLRLPNEFKALTKGAHTQQPNPNAFSWSVPKVRTVRIVRDWFIPGVDDPAYHISDIALLAHPFDALVVNRLGEPWAMLDQLKEQGVIN